MIVRMISLFLLFLFIKSYFLFSQNLIKVQLNQIPEIFLDADDNTFSNPKGQLLPFKTNKITSYDSVNSSIIYFENLDDDSKWLKDENWKIEIAQPQEKILAERPNDLIFNSTNLHGDNAFTAVYSPSILVPQRSMLREHYKFVIKTWFELEYYYDFGKILISDDEGQNWHMLGYVTGKSNNWLDLEYDISDYCGKNINIAFLLTSDNSITFQGWKIAEMKIESILTGSWKTDTGGDLDLFVGWNNKPNPAWWQYNPSEYDPPLDFNILVDEDISVYPTFVLILSAWDVDATGIGDECPGGFPEVDNVYFNGNYVGKLTGANESFSITTFEIKKEWVIGGTPINPGANKIEVYVDVLNKPDNCQDWAVKIDWGELTTKNSNYDGVGFSTTYTDKGTDTNGNGKYEYLDVTATVVVDAGNSGTFNMNGVLKTANGLELAWATNVMYLNSGATNILLRFTGKEINSFCIDGPYYLKNTTVYQVTNPNINGWIVDAHITKSYSFNDFEASPYQKPRVVQKIPEEGSNVPANTEIKAIFNIDMQSSTINTNSFIVKKDTQKVNGIVGYEPSTKTASFVPSSTLESGQHYQVILSTAIKAQNGQNLFYVETWGFSTNYNPINVKLKTISSLNSPIVEVMEGGIVHRYYQVLNENNSPIVGAKLKYRLSNQGVNIGHWSLPSNDKGIVDLNINLGGANKNTTSDDWATSENGEVTVNFQGNVEIPGYSPLIIANEFTSFKLKIAEREFEQSWDILLRGEVGGGPIFGIKLGILGISAAKVSVQAKGGLGYNMTLIKSSDKSDKVQISRRAEAGIGANFSLGKISAIGDIAVLGECNGYVVGRGEQEYLFDDPETDVQRMTQAALLLETLNVGNIPVSPGIGLIVNTIIQVLNEWSGANNELRNHTTKLSIQGGIEADISAGSKLELSQLINYSNSIFGEKKLLDVELPHAELDFAGYIGMDLYQDPIFSGDNPFAPQNTYYRPYVQESLTLDITLLKLDIDNKLKGFEIDNNILLDLGASGRGFLEQAGHFDKDFQFLGLELGIELDGGLSIVLGDKHYIKKIYFYIPKDVVFAFRNQVATNATHLSYSRAAYIGAMAAVLGTQALVQDAEQIIAESILKAIQNKWTFYFEIENELSTVHNGKLGFSIGGAFGPGIDLNLAAEFEFIDSKQYLESQGQFITNNPQFIDLINYQDDIYTSKSSNLMYHIENQINGIWPLIQNAIQNLYDKISGIFEQGQQWVMGWWESLNLEKNAFTSSEEDIFFKIYGNGTELPDNAKFQVTCYSPNFVLANGTTNIYKSNRLKSQANIGNIEGFLVGIGRCYQIDAIDVFGNKISNFQSPTNLTIMVTDKEIHDAGHPLSIKPKIKLYEYSAETNSWTSVSDYYENSNSLSTRISNLATYMLGIEFQVDTKKPGFGSIYPKPDSKIGSLTDIAFAVIDSGGTGIDIKRSIVIYDDTISCELNFDPEMNIVLASHPSICASEEGFHSVYISVYDKTGNQNQIEFTFEISGELRGLTNKNIFIYPNPFNPDKESGTIRYSLNKSGYITVKIYDVGNNLVRTLICNQPQDAGVAQAIEWDGKNDQGVLAANGVYFYVIESSSNERAVGKAAILR